MTCATMDVEDVHNVLSVMQKNLECPICLDVMKEPVATRCDHIFCRFCMLQLLSKKKKGRAQCPMCKKEVTKRSLQDSPRFKLLVDGLLKIINAFELDSGYKFFPSQDYASTVATTRKEAPAKDDQPVVQSTGYRNRSKRGVEDRRLCDRRLSLLDTGTDTRPAGGADTRHCKQPKRQKKETKQLIADFVSDSSEDDLLKKAGSLGSDVDPPSMIIEPSLPFELENKDDCLTANDANDQVSSKLEGEDVAASDLAEYGFSERDLDSIRSNLLSVDGLRTLKESPSKNSAVLKGHFMSDTNVCESGAEGNGGMKLEKVMNLREPNASMQLESQTLKIALDCPYDRDDSTPENMPSTQGSQRDAPYTVSRERLKKSIKKVNEWLLKTDEFLIHSPKDEEMFPDISYVEDEAASDYGSSVSDETKIMAVSHLHVLVNAFEKSIVSVEDKVFGRVYKREKKTNQVGNMTCIADVHVDGVEEPLKVNEVPKPPSSKPRRSSGLQPEHFIKVDQKRQNADSISNGPVMVDDLGLDVEGSHLKAPIASFLDLNKIEEVGQDRETISDAQSNKTKKKSKSLKRKNEKTQRTRKMQALHLIEGLEVDSGQRQSPHHVSEIKIDSYPSSTEPGHDADQKNVRRSKRLNLLKEDTIRKEVRSGGQEIEDPPTNIPTLINCGEPCAVLEHHGPEIHGESPTAVQNETVEGNRHSQMEGGSAHVSDMYPRSSPPPVPDMYSRSSPPPVPNAEELDDSDLDTELLLKTFKSAKRMSFKLDPVTETTTKGNCALMDISDLDTVRMNGHEYKDPIGKSSNFCKPNEDVHFESQCKNIEVDESKHSENLRFRTKSRLSSKKPLKSSAEHPDNKMVHTTKAIAPIPQPNDSKDAEPLGKSNPAKSQGPLLHSETESMSLFPVVTNQKLSAAMRGDTRGGIGQEENEEVRNDYCREDSFDEAQVNQMTSSNSSHGSMTGKLLGQSASHNSSPDKSPEVYSDTPDGLLGGVERLQEDTSCCAVAEKSFVFGDCKKSQLVDGSVSPITQSQVVRRRKRKAQKIESSEEESSGDQELPCFKALFGNTSANADQKKSSASSSPRQQGGGVLAMFSSCSTSGKSQMSFNLPREALVCSQESQCSVNLFSSQSNTSDQSMNGAAGRNGPRTQDRIRENSLKRTRMEEHCNEKANLENGEEVTHLQTDCEDPCQEQNLGEVSGCESEASHTGDSSGLSSQCEILNTQQRDAMQNNLEKLQREMAALEAVLEQHGSQSPTSGREQASTAEQVTIRPQEARQKQADYDIYRSPDAIPETEVPSGQSRSSGQQNIDQPPAVENRSRSPTPPCSLPKATSRKETPEKIQTSFNVFKELRECTLTDDGAMGQKAEDVLCDHDKDCSAPTATNVRNSKSPKRSMRSKLQAVNGLNALREDSRQITEVKGVVQPPQDLIKRPGNTQRSVSPTFKSPLRSKVDPSFKSPVVSIKRNYCLVTSGLSQSEVILVQKFARKTQSIFSSKMTESTTHVIMKTDEQLVCERTLKYFLGIAGRKWVVSHEWIVQSFREGRILDEYDFEVKGDVINGRNHRGPRRSRLGSDGLLFTDFEICCLGSFNDMTRDDLQWMVSLCGASMVPDPSQFVHKSETTSLIVVQPEKECDYPAMRKKYRCLVISREWVLDSVSSYKLQAFDSYLA